ncbi:mitochondrial carrier [Microstroma glucosiphilum]|uniref:Mitochondrial carrier n=1 Tax=Pseudomicrostroma glucosiphilum TaxID=1684307 RepID=A0A316UAE8_9BASI|nr:mitochondrial carrier [Pseudomicrostroma glucosiphilum]PWN22139.1 mitochondrial carrier [Pseudomicrostroma glucosiphilum]
MAAQSRGDGPGMASATPGLTKVLPSTEKKSNNEGSSGSLKGYAAGTASGVTKLLNGHPFDSIKVRMQVSPQGTYKGPIDCFLQMARKESLLGLYKGASPPAVGWAVSDSILLGTLHNLRLQFSRMTGTGGDTGKPLPVQYHALAGLGAGWTNSLITTPTENLKTLLQMQFQRVHLPGVRSFATSGGPASTVTMSGSGAETAARHFTGPIDAAQQIIKHHGVIGLWRTLPATLTFRASFAVMFGSFEVFNKAFANLKGTPYEVSPSIATLLSGGLAAECFWLSALPADNIKNMMMADIPGEKPKYPTMRSAFVQIWNRPGPDAGVLRRIKMFYTGFTPCALRAFPVNAAALFVYEGCMELMGAERTVSK